MTSENPTRSMTELITLDRFSPVPLYFQVAQDLERAIQDGLLPPGTRLDNEIQIADDLGVSRPTMRRALEHLVDKGLIVRRRGIGTRVVQRTVRRSLELSSLYEDLSSDGQQPSTRVLSFKTIPADAVVAAGLQVESGAQVFAIVRLRSTFDQPLARMTNYLPTTIPGLPEQLTAAALAEQGLYQILQSCGVHLHSATQSIGARKATTEEAQLLSEPRGGALLTMDRIAYDDHGRAVEYGRHVYAASRYTFELALLSH